MVVAGFKPHFFTASKCWNRAAGLSVEAPSVRTGRCSLLQKCFTFAAELDHCWPDHTCQKENRIIGISLCDIFGTAPFNWWVLSKLCLAITGGLNCDEVIKPISLSFSSLEGGAQNYGLQMNHRLYLKWYMVRILQHKFLSSTPWTGIISWWRGLSNWMDLIAMFSAGPWWTGPRSARERFQKMNNYHLKLYYLLALPRPHPAARQWQWRSSGRPIKEDYWMA